MLPVDDLIGDDLGDDPEITFAAGVASQPRRQSRGGNSSGGGSSAVHQSTHASITRDIGGRSGASSVSVSQSAAASAVSSSSNAAPASGLKQATDAPAVGQQQLRVQSAPPGVQRVQMVPPPVHLQYMRPMSASVGSPRLGANGLDASGRGFSASLSAGSTGAWAPATTAGSTSVRSTVTVPQRPFSAPRPSRPMSAPPPAFTPKLRTNAPETHTLWGTARPQSAAAGGGSTLLQPTAAFLGKTVQARTAGLATASPTASATTAWSHGVSVLQVRARVCRAQHRGPLLNLC